MIVTYKAVRMSLYCFPLQPFRKLEGEKLESMKGALLNIYQLIETSLTP